MHVRPLKTFTISFVLPHELAFLERLAYNFWWVWHPEAERVFAVIDQERWEHSQRNPVRLLKETPQERFHQLLKDEDYRQLLRSVEDEFTAAMSAPSCSEWPYDGPVAYFCAEYGICECFQNYSGGLGVLAGDHLKTASDLGLPLVGVGLLYQYGYFYQHVTYDGWQQEIITSHDFSLLPLQQVNGEDGKPLLVNVELPEQDVFAQVWKVMVGRVPLYLLDTNISLNDGIPQYRAITTQLYGGTQETRIMQEILLGVGGMRVLDAMGIKPAVIHVNEGHAAFCTIEHTRLCSQRYRISFHEAAEITRAITCFTTHTPVPAGNEIFSRSLVERFFVRYQQLLNISWNEIFAMGSANGSTGEDDFSMTVLGLNMSNHRNGVSLLHGEVARTMWHELWKHVPVYEVPIMGITNGVHLPTWVSSDFASLYDRKLGGSWRERPQDEEIWQAILSVADSELWEAHTKRRQRLFEVVRMRLESQAGFYDEEARYRVLSALQMNCLLIGFARRFALYKRTDLIFRNWERLASILRNPSRPVIILLAGKAHPQDYASKEMMQRILSGIRSHGLEQHIIFLEDYDLGIARALVKGVDVWLNTPRRPYEASGTSGMKAVLNGALHCSVLDGWWAEAWRGDNGFTIGSGEMYATPDLQDVHESESLYQLLENEIVPAFYERDASGIPHRWVQRMKIAIATCAARFSTVRMLEEYHRLCYVPAASLGVQLQVDGARGSCMLQEWKSALPQRWATVQIHHVDIGDGNYVVGQTIPIRVQLCLGQMSAEEVLAQAYYGPVNSQGEFVVASTVNLPCVRQEGGTAIYEGSVIARESGHQGVTIRVLPAHQYVPNPVDLKLVAWADGRE